MNVDEIARRIRERLHVDERVAVDAGADPGVSWTLRLFPGNPDGTATADGIVGSHGRDVIAAGNVGAAIGQHIVRQDPDKTLFRVGRERQILDWCTEVLGDRDLSRYGEFGSLEDEPHGMAITLAAEILLLLARE